MYRGVAVEETGVGYWTCPPDSEKTIPLPNFAESLDACFKWLVPKATALIVFNPIWGLTKEQGIDEATEILFREWLRQMAYPNKNDDALALCLAIEKLIDRR